MLRIRPYLCLLAGRCLGVMIALSSLKGCYSAGRVVDIAVRVTVRVRVVYISKL